METVITVTKPDSNVNENGTVKLGVQPLVHPGGVPRVIEGRLAVDTEVTISPLTVMVNVSRVGEGDTVGIAVG